jgi:outer membrane protein assembly factor BamE
MMLAFVQFEDRRSALEVMTRHQSCGLKLRQHAVHSCKADVFVGVEQMFVNVLSTHMPRRGRAQNVENLDAGHSDLEPRPAQIIGFHETSSSPANRLWYDSRPIICQPLPFFQPFRQMLSQFMRLRSIVLVASFSIALGTTLSGCIYRLDTVQGNFLVEKDTDQISVGMTRSQVQYALGTPMVADPFNNERWDYIYYWKIGRTGKTGRRNFTVYFADNKVTRIETSGVATAQS